MDVGRLDVGSSPRSSSLLYHDPAKMSHLKGSSPHEVLERTPLRSSRSEWKPDPSCLREGATMEVTHATSPRTMRGNQDGRE